MPSPSFQYYIAYSVSDRVMAKTLAAKLRQQQISVFFDETDLVPGDDLEQIARQAPAILVIISRFAIIDKKVMAIVTFALQQKQKVVPVIIETCAMPAALKKIVTIELVNNFEPGLKQLVTLAQKSAFASAMPSPANDTVPSPGLQKGLLKKMFDNIGLFKSKRPMSMGEVVIKTTRPVSGGLDNMMQPESAGAEPPPDFAIPAPAAPPSEPPPANTKGKVLYDIPDTMQENQECTCVVRIGKNEQVVLDDDHFSPAVKIEDVPIARVMNVDLLDIGEPPRFKIKTVNSGDQEVDNESYTEWVFWVTPLTAGTYPLVLKISVIKIIDGKERRKELVFQKKVNVDTLATAPAQVALPLVGSATPKPAFNSLNSSGEVVEADPPVAFISYAHKDKTYFDIFIDYLKSQSGWNIWTDRNIEVGSDWYQRIQSAINGTDIAVLLISADFISSAFIKNHELSSLRSLQPQKAGFIFLPILLRDTDFTRWKELASMQLFVAYGDEYGVPEMKGKMIPFAQLCRFDTAGQLIPNTYIDTYFKNLVKTAEKDWLKTKVPQ